MLEPILLQLLATIRRELSRLIFLGLLFTYALAAWEVCGAGACSGGLQPAIFAIIDQTSARLWPGMALAFMVEFTGGIIAMTIGLAWDWWKQRPEKAAEQARAEAVKAAEQARTELETTFRHREMLLRAGIDPDTGEPLTHYNGANHAPNGNPEK